MMSVLGFVLPHDDSVNDRSEGSKLNNADEITRKLWMQAYDVSFGRPGSMYRGLPPKVAPGGIRSGHLEHQFMPRPLVLCLLSLKLKA